MFRDFRDFPKFVKACTQCMFPDFFGDHDIFPSGSAEFRDFWSFETKSPQDRDFKNTGDFGMGIPKPPLVQIENGNTSFIRAFYQIFL